MKILITLSMLLLIGCDLGVQKPPPEKWVETCVVTGVTPKDWSTNETTSFKCIKHGLIIFPRFGRYGSVGDTVNVVLETQDGAREHGQ